MSEPLLSLNQVTVSFPGPNLDRIQVVRELSLKLESGRTLGLVGESGSGKSMTALAVLGLVPLPGRVHGSIRFQGQEWMGLDDDHYRKLRGAVVSIVFQDPATALNPVMTIEAQMLETIMLHQRVDRHEARQRALMHLSQVEIPNPASRLRDYPHQFSGGMKQRIMIAMALACEPACLILDEPTTALDVTVQAQILDLIERIQNVQNTAILLISHDLGVIAESAHEVAIMYAGQIVEQGEIAAILHAPRHPYTRALMESIPQLGRAKTRLQTIPGLPPNPAIPPSGCLFHPRCPRRLDLCSEESPRLTGESNHTVACWNPEATPFRIASAFFQSPAPAADTIADSEPNLLRTIALGRDYLVKSIRYSQKKQVLKAVDRVTLTLPKGKIVGLVGESGSGKSTLARMISRLEDPSRGEIYLDDWLLSHQIGRELRQLRQRFQPVFQDPNASLNPRLTVRAMLEEPLKIHHQPHQTGDILGLLEQTGLGQEVMERYPHQLSGGQRQRLGLARALAVNPELLIADEPLSSLDVSIQAQILNLLLDLQAQRGLTLLFISHDLRVVGHLADWVVVLYAGRMMEWGSAEQLYHAPRHPYTWALLAALPQLQPGRGRLRAIVQGDTPSPINPKPGCRFYERCPFHAPECLHYENQLLAVTSSHSVACVRWSEIKSPALVNSSPSADN